MKTRLIFNPKSGRAGRTARIAPLLREFVAASHGRVELSVTEGPGHATLLAAEAVLQGCERVVAVGGDGTLNETAQALLHQPAALGLVPCGSGNGLARHLLLPGSPLAALRLVGNPDAAVRFIDTGLADGKPFFNVMGLGLDAEVSRRFNLLRRRGLPAYAVTAWKAYRSRIPESCVISDGVHREVAEVFMLSVANSAQYGNDARIAPGARLDDGALDLVSVSPLDLWQAAEFAARLFFGNVFNQAQVRHWQGPRFRIERAAAGIIHTDGETHQAGATVEVTVAPASLRVLVAPSGGGGPPVRNSGRSGQAQAFALSI